MWRSVSEERFASISFEEHWSSGYPDAATTDVASGNHSGRDCLARPVVRLSRGWGDKEASPKGEPDGIQDQDKESEPANLPKEVKAEPKPKYVAGQWVGDEVLDPDRIPKGYKCENGRITRQNRRENGRLDGIWPEIWSLMTPKEKQQARAKAS